MIRLSASFANALVCFLRKDKLIRFPEITITLATFVFLWNLLPQFAAGCLASITDNKSHNLTGSAAHHCPNPAFVPSFVDKRPHFIGFQDIFGFSWQKRVFKFRIGFVFFLARMPELDDSRQKCVVHRAYWSVLGRLTRSVLSALRCIHVSVQEHRVSRSLCTSIADCHWHYGHFSRCFGYYNFCICR
jgi:hypothetical protein